MKVAAIDIETTGLNPREDEILSIAIVTEDKEVVIDTSQYHRIQVKAMMEKLRTQYDVVIAHNAKFDASFIYTHYDILFRNLYCTMLGSQIIKNGHKEVGHSLIACLKNYLNVDEIETDHKKLMRWKYLNHKVGEKIDSEMADYVLSDTKYLIPLWKEQVSRLKILEMEKIAHLENALIPVLIKMEIGGCLIDRDGWVQMLCDYEDKRQGVVERLDAEVKELAESITELQGGIYTRPRHTETVVQQGLFGTSKEIVTESKGALNYSSSQQIIEFIKRVDGVEVESVGVDEIKTYMNEHTDTRLEKFMKLLLEYREYDKMLSTYGDKFLAKLDADDYIHTQYTQCRTKTGRLASQNPNLQNIPNGDIREFFIAKPGHKMITCDMASAEVSIAADFSREPLLLDAILHGADMHSKLASVSFSIIFGQPIEVNNTSEVVKVGEYEFKKKALRKIHKSVTFAKFYKAGAGRIYQTLASYINKFHEPNDRLDVARSVSRALDKEMPKLTQFLSVKINMAQKNGYLRGAYGRIRFFKEEVYGEAANFPIQNANAEAMKIALIRIDTWLEDFGHGRLVMNIHDEAVVEVEEEYAEEAADMVQHIMARSLSYFLNKIEGGASANIKDHWEK